MSNAVPWSGPKSIFRALWKFFFPEWRFQSAQWYELVSAKGTMKRSLVALLDTFDKERDSGGLWHSANDRFFNGDDNLFRDFVDHVRDRTCLEIGSGPYGYLAPAYWIKSRKVIDPLISKYRDFQLRNCGRTFWTSDIVTFAVPAEQTISELVGAIDGAIICQNALDHTEDPLGVLNAISKYAAPGCFFLFWTDTWHIHGTDIGHRNITRCVEIMPKIIFGLGFDIIKTGDVVRDGGDTIEYGCIARKR